ncbi:MAG TPA: DNA polymerase III subunit delta' [Epsilonproteobacteria bacterium]|nr:DNA polymerase III subunit delta' [Campylobacterota bacterium]
MKLISQVIISEDIEGTIASLEALKTTELFIKIVKEDRFLIEDAKIAIEKAHITHEATTVLILAGKSFEMVVQNKLLKILEEPPPNKIFILVAAQKATILDTIKSRLPLYIDQTQSAVKKSPLDMSTLSLATLYQFIQSSLHISQKDAKEALELIILDAMRSGCYDLDEKTLMLFGSATRVLGVGSPPVFVLSTVLLKLLARKKNRHIKGAHNAAV